ncbi:MAG: hypothetical protein HKO65_11055 [Gemmatimonadetes bacterium]|nr:hypothetical protein [Gemmatimonadota bacterium]
MESTVIARFNDPSAAAKYLGETVGTHYSAALRAAKAYGNHLAGKRESLLSEEWEGTELGDFWRDLIRSEQVLLGSPKVLRGLSSTPAFFFQDFLPTAEAEYRRRYKRDTGTRKKGSLKSEHAQCLAFLRESDPGGPMARFTMEDKVTTWMQLLRIFGKYQE